MADVAFTAFQVIGSMTRDVLDIHAARELNAFETQASKTRFDFFRSLNDNPDTSTYVTELEENLYPAYDDMASNLKNPYARQQVQTFLERKKEEDRQTALTLADRNAKVYGAQELITSLDEIIARGVAPGESLVPTDEQKSYLQNRQEEIAVRIGQAYGSGLIDQDRAAELSRKYTGLLQYGHSRDMAFEALDTMLDENMSVNDSLDAIEKVIRTEGPVSVEIPIADGRLAVLGEAYSYISLTPDDEEKLVKEVRGEARAKMQRKEEQAQEQIEFNDLELSKLWAAGAKGREQMMKDDYAMLYEVFDAGTPEGRKEIGKWIEDLGEWKLKDEAAYEKQQAMREYDIEIDRIMEDEDAEAIGELKTRILNDEKILDPERDQMVSLLNGLAEDLKPEGEQDTEGRDNELLKARIDGEIVDLTYAVMEGDSGVADQIKNLIKEIQDTEYFQTAEQDRNERVNELIGLLEDAGDSAQGTVAAKSRIGQMFSNPAYSEKDIREAIRTAESNGEITSNEANTFFGRIDDRADKFLGDYHAETAYNAISRYYDAQIRDPDIDAEERAQLAQDQITAETAMYELIDSEAYRNMNPAQKKEELDKIIADSLAPAVERSFLRRAGEFVGISGAPSKYEQFQVAQSESRRETLYKEIALEWTEQFTQDFSDTWLAEEAAAGRFASRKRKVDDTWLIELRHPSGLLLKQERGRWYVQFPGETEYKQVTNRLLGENTRAKLEEFRG